MPKVGVGDGDMKAMVQLDSDKARLHSKGDQAARDIVQFVREFFLLVRESQNWI